MDDFVTLLELEQNNPNGLLMQILEAGYESWDYVAAVEGPDDQTFYFDFLRDYCKTDNIYFLICGGKNSLTAFQKVAKDYDWSIEPSIIYICDKDFDDYLGRNKIGIWYTEYYSIENFFARPEYLEYVLAKFSKGPLELAEKAKVIEDFRSNFFRMANRARAFSAYACGLRCRNIHPNFDKFGIEQLFSLSGASPAKIGNSLARAKEVLEVDADIPSAELRKWARRFNLSNVQQWLRGKLALQIARKAYELAVQSAPANCRNKLPTGNYFGRDCFNHAKNYLLNLPSLKLYCESL